MRERLELIVPVCEVAEVVVPECVVVKDEGLPVAVGPVTVGLAPGP